MEKSANEPPPPPRKLPVDKLPVIGRTHLWLLGSFLLLSSAILLWSYFGSLPLVISGRGIIMHQRGGFTVEAILGGIVRKINVKMHQEVEEGDVITEIYDPKEEIKLSLAQDNVAQLKERFSQLQVNIEKEAEAIRKSITTEIQANDAAIEEKNKNLVKLNEDLEKKRDVLAKALISSEQFRAAEQMISQANLEIEALKVANEGLKAKLLKGHRTEEIKLGLTEIFQAESLRDMLKSSLDYAKTRSPHPGIVLDLFINIDDHVKTGQPLAWLDTRDSPDNPLLIYAYFPIEQAKSITVGQRVSIQVTSQTIAGVVTSASQHAISSESLLRRYQSKTLGEYLKGGAPEVVEVTITPDALPDKSRNKITSGTIVQIDATLENIRPIYYVLPLERFTRYTNPNNPANLN